MEKKHKLPQVKPCTIVSFFNLVETIHDDHSEDLTEDHNQYPGWALWSCIRCIVITLETLLFGCYLVMYVRSPIFTSAISY